MHYDLDWKPKPFNEYMDKLKGHLIRLPPVPKDVAAQHNYNGNSKKALVLYTVYATVEGEHSYYWLNDWILRSACWGKHSWERNSDAQEHDIKIGFYVDDSIKDIAEYIFNESHVDINNDVFYFKDSKNYGRYNKKLEFVVDEQFAEYEWVLQCDADVFVCSKNENDKIHKMPFFDNLFKLEHDKIGAMKLEEHYTPIVNTYIINNVKCNEGQDKIQAWKEITQELVNRETADKWIEGTDIIHPNGGIYAVPMSHFYQSRIEELVWLYTAGSLYRDDEMTFSMWEYKSEQNMLFDICTLQQSPFMNNKNLVDLRPEHDNYLLHYFGCSAELFFREDIGVVT